tara:strand:- start:976 stop:1203 length:228 start_codon:yes stop_codon:yes gene_type:complete
LNPEGGGAAHATARGAARRHDTYANLEDAAVGLEEEGSLVVAFEQSTRDQMPPALSLVSALPSFAVGTAAVVVRE